MSASSALEKGFEVARALAETRREFSGLPAAQKLQLYALFKQANFGDAPDKEPSRFAPTEHAKWTAWRKVLGWSRERAIREYGALVRSVTGEAIVGLSDDGADADDGGGGDDDDDEDDAAAEAEDALMSHIGGAVFSMPVQAEAEQPAAEHAPGSAGAAFALLRAGSVARLLQRLAEPDASELARAVDEDGRTLLHWASDGGHAAVCRALLALGAPVDAQDAEGLTALHMAALCEHEAALAVLLAAGADDTIEDADGSTPLSCIRPKLRPAVDAAVAEERARAAAAQHAASVASARPTAEAAGFAKAGVARSADRGPRSRVGAWPCALAVALVGLAIAWGRHLGLVLSPTLASSSMGVAPARPTPTASSLQAADGVGAAGTEGSPRSDLRPAEHAEPDAGEFEAAAQPQPGPAEDDAEQSRPAGHE